MKAIVLLSGGIDSTTCLALAVKEYGAKDVLALTAYYGQKHMRELEAADNVAAFYGVDHMQANLSKVYRFSDCPLLMTSYKKVPHQSYAEQLAKKPGTVETYVPFRNGLFLSYAAAIAISVGAEVIYYGAHADDAAGQAYPDCTPEFVEHMNMAVYEGSDKTCQIKAPLILMNKAEVVAQGLQLKAPYHLTWSCYEGQGEPCGECGTCIDRAKAFEANGIKDPAMED